MLKILAIFFTTTAMLNCAPLTHNFYSGLTFGANHMSGVRNDSAREENGASANFTINKRTRSNAGYGGILAGYLMRITDFGIGTEAFYNYGKIESSAGGILYYQPNALTVSFRMKNRISNQHGIVVRLGYFFKSYFFYTSLGINKQSEKFDVTADESRNGAISGYHFKKKNKTNRFSFGLGTQKSVSETIDIGVEYKTTRIPKKNYTFYLNDIDETLAKSDFKYRLHTLAVRLIYKF